MSESLARYADLLAALHEITRLRAEKAELLAALVDCRDLIQREYSDPRSAALEGHPIAREARAVWDTTCSAIAKAEGKQP